MACQVPQPSTTLPPRRRNTATPNSNAQVAQLVEQLAFNQLVLGSNPSLRTFSPPAPLIKRCVFVSSSAHQRTAGWDENPCEASGLTADFALAKIYTFREAHTAGTERSEVNPSRQKSA